MTPNACNRWILRSLALICVLCFLSSCNRIFEEKLPNQSYFQESYYSYSWNKKKIILKERRLHHMGSFLPPIPTGTNRYETDADPKTFVVLGYDLGKDAQHIYMGTTKVTNVDAETFEMLDSELYRDKNNIYKGSLTQEDTLPIWEEVDASTYESLEDSWAKDKKGYLYYGNRVNVDKETFKLLGTYFGADKDNFYIFSINEEATELIPLHDTLRQITKHSYTDSKQIFTYNYYNSPKIEIYEIKNIETLVVYDFDENIYSFGEDKLYWGNKFCDFKFDKITFKLLNKNYALDKNHVYYRGTVMADADPAHFKILGDAVSKDDIYVFVGSNIIKGVDAPSARMGKNSEGERLIIDKFHTRKYNRKSRGWEIIGE